MCFCVCVRPCGSQCRNFHKSVCPYESLSIQKKYGLRTGVLQCFIILFRGMRSRSDTNFDKEYKEVYFFLRKGHSRLISRYIFTYTFILVFVQMYQRIQKFTGSFQHFCMMYKAQIRHYKPLEVV